MIFGGCRRDGDAERKENIDDKAEDAVYFHPAVFPDSGSSR
jgi:hypothetical protein